MFTKCWTLCLIWLPLSAFATQFGDIPVSQTIGSLSITNDTNVTLTLGGTSTDALLKPFSITVGWTGTLAAGRLNSNVVQGVTNDTNITGSITAQNLTLGWSGTLAAARLNGNVVQAVTNDTNVTGSISGQNLTLGWSGALATGRGGVASGGTTGQVLTKNSNTNYDVGWSSPSSGAPSTATYVTEVPEAGLSNEFALSTLATGLLKNTTSTGVPTIAVAKTDYWDTTDFVASGASHAHGLVPDPGSTAGTTRQLREDGWAYPFYGGSITGHGDSNYNILSTDRVVYTNAAFTGTHNWFLPLANSVAAGTAITIADWQKTVTMSNSIAINRSGTDTIGPLASGTTVYILTQGESITLMSDGSSRWFVTDVTGGTAITGRFMQGSINGDSSWSQSVYGLPLSIQAAGRIFMSDGSNVGFSTPAFPTLAGGVGYTVRSNGTDFQSYPQDILNSSTTDLTVSTSDIYLAGSSCVVTAGDMKAKGQYHCVFDMVKTAGTGAIVITVRIGTAGTTGDTSRITFTFGTGTSVADTAIFDVWVVWRSVGSGTSAVVSGICKGVHNLPTTGMFNNADAWTIVGTTSGGFDSSGATTIGLSFNGGTAFAGTNKLVQATLTQ